MAKIVTYHTVTITHNDVFYVPRQDPHNMTGQTIEHLTHLTKSEAMRIARQRKATIFPGDTITMSKHTARYS